jgi:hypothetical protein
VPGTLRHLTQEEQDSPVHVELRHQFTEPVEARLGPGASDTNFDAEDLTPEYPHYESQTYLETNRFGQDHAMGYGMILRGLRK